MEIFKLSPDEYQSLLNEWKPDYNFFQSAAYARRFQDDQEPFDVLAGYEDDKPVFGVIIAYQPALKIFSVASSRREWVAFQKPDDLKNEKLVKDFVDGIVAYLKSNKRVIFWSVESGVCLRERDRNGAIVEGGFDNKDYRKMMEQIGFIPRTLWKGNWLVRQSRYISRIDLIKDPDTSGYPDSHPESHEWKSWNDLLEDMPGNQRRRMNGHPDLHVKEYELDGVDMLHQMLETAGDLHGFSAMDKSQLESYVKSFKDDKKLLVAMLDLKSAYERQQQIYSENGEKIEELEAVLKEKPQLKKKRSALNKAIQEKDKAEEQMKQLVQLAANYNGGSLEGEIPAAASLFLLTPTECIYLVGGSRHDMSHFNATYSIQKAMIKDSLENHRLRHNFWGISGFFEPGETGYGVFNFKRLLGGVVSEYCGEFIYPLHPRLCEAYTKSLIEKEFMTAPETDIDNPVEWICTEESERNE